MCAIIGGGEASIFLKSAQEIHMYYEGPGLRSGRAGVLPSLLPFVRTCLVWKKVIKDVPRINPASHASLPPAFACSLICGDGNLTEIKQVHIYKKEV